MRSIILGIIGTLCYLQSFGSTSVAAKIENENFVLKNKSVELVFANGKDFLFKEFRMDGINILSSAGSTTFPWQLIYRGPNGENPTLQPKWGEYKGGEIQKDKDAYTLIFTWQMVINAGPTCPVRMLVTLGKDAELPEWRIEAEIPDEWVITESEFPRIAVNRPTGAKAILPVAFGTEYAIGIEGQLQSRYPSATGTMQLVLMYHKGGTVYLSAQDKGGSGKIFRMKSEGDNLVFIQNVTTSYGWTQNKKFTLPWPTVMGFTKEGWQDAVERWYRPFTFETLWGAKTITERSIAEWIKKADLWLRPMHVNVETIEAVRKAMKYFGKDVGLHWYYWHQHLMDTKYPEYLPAKEGFAEMVKETRELGGYVTPYINGRLWDPATEMYKTHNGKDASCRKPDGTLYTEVYSSKVLNTVTCPSSYIWRDILKSLNQQILTELKTDGVYLDQIGCANSEPCYATNHGHAPGGGDWWHFAYRSLLNEMRTNLYKENQAMTTEENAECYIDLFDMMLIVNSPHNKYTKMVPLFPIIYSDRCIYSGYTYIPWQITDGSLNFITMRSLLWGSQLGWAEPDILMRPESKREAKFLKNLTNFRRQHHDLFLGGRFLKEIIPTGDNPTQDIPNYETTPVILAAEWVSLSGGHAYLVANMSEQDHTVTLPNQKQVNIKALEAIRIPK
jgi:hypothetical protein